MTNHTHIRLEYKPKESSRVWRKSSLSMWKAGYENMVKTAKSLKIQDGWYDYRVVEFTP